MDTIGVHRPSIEGLEVSCFQIPTDEPESDGTLQWSSTTMIVIEACGAGQRGLGYSYGHRAAAEIVATLLFDAVRGIDIFSVRRAWSAMRRAVRNVGRPGIAATAISAVDTALWDLKARVLGLSLVDLLGSERDAIPAYGSGGFTSYSIAELQAQLSGWAEAGFGMVKMKVGRNPDEDATRVKAAREAIGDDTDLFVDANGAYTRPQAIAMAQQFATQGVSWYEEPVSSDDVEGLRRVRESAPAGMAVAAGEYGYDEFALHRLLDAGAVDVLQADATRCLGITGFMDAAALCSAHGVSLSAHCAPSIHVHTSCAAPAAIHIELFHDHSRIEHMLFDGAPRPSEGTLAPARGRPGLGLELRRSDARRYAIG